MAVRDGEREADAKRLEQIRESALGDYLGGEGECLGTAVEDVWWLLARDARLVVERDAAERVIAAAKRLSQWEAAQVQAPIPAALINEIDSALAALAAAGAWAGGESDFRFDETTGVYVGKPQLNRAPHPDWSKKPPRPTDTSKRGHG